MVKNIGIIMNKLKFIINIFYKIIDNIYVLSKYIWYFLKRELLRVNVLFVATATDECGM